MWRKRALLRQWAGRRQRGLALIEFAVVGPIITVMGLALVQYAMLFFAKSQINHSSFMAARAGSVGHANLETVRNAYAQALVPLYGGGENAAELATALAEASKDVAEHAQITLLNPTKESFTDFNDPALQAKLGTGSKRVISNSNLAFKPAVKNANSGQTLQDANILKLRIVHGYKPQVPIVASIYKAYLKWLDTGTDAFQTKLAQDGLIPIETHITMQMQSDAIESDAVISTPGSGNEGNPTNPGDPPVVETDPPDCPLGGCTTEPGPGTGGDPTCF
jgi:Flp pilus assembly protein TadG